MMKNIKHKFKKGFSLVEMLVVVAIIAILVAVSMIAVSSYQRTLKAVEMDGIAEEMFLVAQNNLSSSYEQGYLGTNSFGIADTTGNDIYFLIHTVGDEVEGNQNLSATSSYSTSTMSLLSLLLPDASFDSTVKNGGNYVIRYQKSTGIVLGVFYSESASNKFGHEFTQDELATLFTVAENNGEDYMNSRNVRKNCFDGAVIGYYGADDGRDGRTKNDSNVFTPASVKSSNGVKFEIYLTIPNYSQVFETGKSQTAEIYFTVTGEKSGASITKQVGTVQGDGITFNKSNQFAAGALTYDDKTRVATIVIDDITVSGLRFAQQYKTGSNGIAFIPGEDLSFVSEAKLAETQGSTTTYVKILESIKEQGNSLFGSSKTVAVNGNEVVQTTHTETTVAIGNVRHLENLDPRVSGFVVGDIEVIVAKQTNDIDVSTFFASDKHVIYTTSGNEVKQSNKFLPIVPTYILTYDGNSKKLSNITVVEESGAGLFGDVDERLNVKNLSIVNPKIKSTKGNAGALAATINNSGSTVFGVIAYNDVDNDVTYEICAAKNAGGLIGQTVNCDNVDNAAAAVYVRAAGNAGGLIGKASADNGSTGLKILTDSYSGGHTQSARYTSEFVTKDQNNNDVYKVRVNVIAGDSLLKTTDVTLDSTIAAGGLIGTITHSGFNINYCYSSASAGTQDANVISGGFIGYVAATGLTINHTYSVGRVVGVTRNKSGAFFGQNGIGASGNKNTNYYLANISLNLRTQSWTDKNIVKGVSGKSSAASQKLVLSSGSRRQANSYDIKLITEYSNRYYFPTIDQLHELYNDTTDYIVSTGITDIHNGDWQIPSLDTTAAYFENGDKLILYVDKSVLGGVDEFVLSITGETSGEAKYLKVNTENSTITITNGTISIFQYFNWDRNPANYEVLYTAGSNLIGIVIDDITTAGKSFCEQFNKFIPGECITARIATGKRLDPLDLANEVGATTNSLFAYVEDGTSSKLSEIIEVEDHKNGEITSRTLKAYVTSIRHLQNLEASVSDVLANYTSTVYDNGTWLVKKVQNECDIDVELLTDLVYADTEFASNGIFKKNATSAISGFIAINNSSIKAFNGNMRTLEGFAFKENVSKENNKDVYNGAGLFARLYAGTTVEKIILSECSASGNADVGMLVGAIYSGTADTKVRSVLVTNSDKSTDTNSAYVSSTSNNAGGLIGYIYGSGKVIIDNSAATVCVRATNTSTNNASAGGLIGFITGANVEIKNSYAGGHTDGLAQYTAGVASNVYGYKYAGGLVGYAGESAVLTISNSFSAASVYGTIASGDIIGLLNASATFNTVYAAGPATGAENAKVGAFIGMIGNNGSIGDTSVKMYYLPEIYDTEVSTIGEVANAENATAYRNKIAKEYYLAEGQTSTTKSDISTKDAGDAYKVKTVVYDATLKNKQYEFPFVVWTKMYRENDSSKVPSEIINTYYGDWRPVEVEEKKTVNVEFRTFISGITEIGIPSGALQVYLRGAGVLSVPALETVYEESEIEAFYLYSSIPAISSYAEASSISVSADNLIPITNYNSEKGQLTISEELEGKLSDTANNYIIVVYKKNVKSDINVIFHFDTSFTNNYQGSNVRTVTVTVKAGTKISDVRIPEYFVDGVNRLNDVEWYRTTSTTFTTNAEVFVDSNKFDLSGNTNEVQNQIVLWAKNKTESSTSKRIITINCIEQIGETLNTTLLKTVQHQYVTTSQVKVSIPVEGLNNYSLIGVKNSANETVQYSEDYKIDVAAGNTNLVFTATFKSKGEGSGYTPGYSGQKVSYRVEYYLANTQKNTSGSYSYKNITTSDIFSGCDPLKYEGFSDVHGTPVKVLKTLNASGETVSSITVNEHFESLRADTATNASIKTLLKQFYIHQIEYVTLDASKTTDVTGADDDTYNVIKVYLKRTEYELSFANTNVFVSPIFVEAGMPLTPKTMGSALYTVEQSLKTNERFAKTGYQPFAFADPNNESWVLTYGGSNHPITDDSTMPCANVVATAQWVAKNDTKYTVLYHYENTDDSDYTVLGHQIGEGTTGAIVNGYNYRNYNGSANIHTHSIACYANTADYLISMTSGTWYTSVKIDGMTYAASVTIKIGNTSITQSNNANYPDGTVATCTYSGSVTENTKAYTGYNSLGKGSSFKCVKVGNVWYAYAGDVTSGNKVTCTYWTGYFTFNSATQKTISGDGSTVVDVYFKRNTYTLTFNLGSTHTHTADCKVVTAQTHVCNSECYTLICKIDENKPHTTACCNLQHKHVESCYQEQPKGPFTLNIAGSSNIGYDNIKDNNSYKVNGTIVCYAYSNNYYYYLYYVDSNSKGGFWHLGTDNASTCNGDNSALNTNGINWDESKTRPSNGTSVSFALNSEKYTCSVSGSTVHTLACYGITGSPSVGSNTNSGYSSLDNNKDDGTIACYKYSSGNYYVYFRFNSKWYYLGKPSSYNGNICGVAYNGSKPSDGKCGYASLSLSCNNGGSDHEHSLSCYGLTGSFNTSATGYSTVVNNGESQVNGTIARYRVSSSVYHYYIKCSGKWYYLGTSKPDGRPSAPDYNGGVTYSSSPKSTTCGQTVNTCASTLTGTLSTTQRVLTCTTTVHDHSSGVLTTCNSAKCTDNTHMHSHGTYNTSPCYEFRCTGKLNSGGTEKLVCGFNTAGTKYTITAKYDQNIESHFPIGNKTGTQYNNKWSEVGTAHYTESITFLANMPAFNTTFNAASKDDYLKVIHYYREVLEEDLVGLTEEQKKAKYYYTTIAVDFDNTIESYNSSRKVTKYYELYKTVYHYNWSLTRSGDFPLLSGFERYAFRDGDLNALPQLDMKATHYAAENNTGYSNWLANAHQDSYNAVFFESYRDYDTTEWKYARNTSQYARNRDGSLILGYGYGSYSAAYYIDTNVPAKYGATSIYGNNDFYYSRKVSNLIFISFTNAADNTTAEETLYTKELQYGASIDRYVPTSYNNGWVFPNNTLAETSAFDTPSYIPTGKVFAGWYLDADFTIKYEAGMTMPDGEIRLYAKYEATTSTATFHYGKTDETMEVTINNVSGYGNAASNVAFSINVGSDRTLKNNDRGNNIFDDEGNLLEEYTPSATGRSFAYWYYYNVTTQKEDRLTSNTVIEKNIDLYPRWQDELENRTITVQYITKNGDTVTSVRTQETIEWYVVQNGAKIPCAAGTTGAKHVKVGDQITISAPTINNYVLNTTSSWVCTVQQKADVNTVIFYYSLQGAEIAWSCKVEYRVRFRSTVSTYEAKTDIGGTYSDMIEFCINSGWLNASGGIGSTQTVFGKTGYPTVVGYAPGQNYTQYYKIDGITYNGNEVLRTTDDETQELCFNTNESEIINFKYWINGENTLIFYLTPDTANNIIKDGLQVNGDSAIDSQHHTYNGQNFVYRLNGNTYNFANGIVSASVVSTTNQIGRYSLSGINNITSAELKYTYCYFKYDGSQYNRVTDELKHAGTYGINVYVTLTLNYTENGTAKTATYLIWQSTDKSIKLVIDPLKVTLTSDGCNEPYNNQNKYTRDKRSNISGIDSILKADQSALSIVFSVDSFRMDVGTTPNAFTATFTGDFADQLNGDYVITTVFGALSVYWNATADFSVRYNENAKIGEGKTGVEALNIATQVMKDNSEHKAYSGTEVIGATDECFTVQIPKTAVQAYIDKGFYRVVYEITSIKKGESTPTTTTVVIGNLTTLANATSGDSINVNISPEIKMSYVGGYSSAVHVYLQLDPEKIAASYTVQDKVITYGQTPSSFVDTTKSYTLTTPEGYVITISTQISSIVNEAGEKDDNVIMSNGYYNAGKYFVTVDSMVTIKNGDTTIITLEYGGSVAKTATLNVNKKKVTLSPVNIGVVISSGGYIPLDADGNFILESLTTNASNGQYINVTWDGEPVKVGDTEITLVDQTSVKFMPGVDFNIGRCSAAFTYKLMSNQNENNFDIVVSNANKLTVEWKMAVTLYLRFKSVKGQITEYSFADILSNDELKAKYGALIEKNITEMTYSAITGTFNPFGYVKSISASSELSGKYVAVNSIAYDYNGVKGSVMNNGWVKDIYVYANKKAVTSYGPAELKVYYEFDEVK